MISIPFTVAVLKRSFGNSDDSSCALLWDLLNPIHFFSLFEKSYRQAIAPSLNQLVRPAFSAYLKSIILVSSGDIYFAARQT